MQLGHSTIQELSQALKQKQISESELLRWSYGQINQYDQHLGSVIELFDEQSVVKRTTPAQGMLGGIPGIFKDNICITGRPMACASKILEGYTAPYDATVYTKVTAAGAPVIGRGNMDEFAMGSSTETSAFFPARNPWDVTRVPGGSSGGPAVAVAAGFVPWALGSETSGSVRQPAAWCGIVGSKPTYGLVSRYGLTAYASSLDQIGVFTRSVYDNALVLSTIAGGESVVRDSTLRPVPAGYDLTRSLDGKIRSGLRIGIIDQALYAEGVSPEVVTAIELVIEELRKLGADCTSVSLPSMELGAATYFVVSRAEAASNLSRFDGIRYGRRAQGAAGLEEVYTRSRSEGFGDEVQRRILIGNYVLSHGHADAFYRSARKAQERMRAECAELFKTVDLLIAPVSPAEAYKFGEISANSLQLDLQDYFTCFANLVGIPALAFPCGFTAKTNMPIGVQLMGPHWSEELLMQTAYAYEQKTPWHTMHPDLEKLSSIAK